MIVYLYDSRVNSNMTSVFNFLLGLIYYDILLFGRHHAAEIIQQATLFYM